MICFGVDMWHVCISVCLSVCLCVYSTMALHRYNNTSYAGAYTSYLFVISLLLPFCCYFYYGNTNSFELLYFVENLLHEFIML